MSPPRPLTADLLLEHRGFLQALARSLVRDEQRAEDVVQDTFVAALRKPPPNHVGLRAWLGAVTRNLALRTRRREGRLRRREERAAKPESLRPTADIAARVEVQRQISEAVARMDEPGRSAIVWRYFDGLPPREIAQMEGVSVRTVESRLRRAREHLRSRLDRDYGGDRAAWCAALVPLIGTVSASSAAASGAGASAASGGTGIAGGLGTAAVVGATIVNTKLIVSVAALCVAGAFFVGRSFPTSPAEPAQDNTPAGADDAGGPVLQGAVEEQLRRAESNVDALRSQNQELTSTNDALKKQVEAARAAGFLPDETKPGQPAPRAAPFTPEKFKIELDDVTWPEAGKAAAKMVPLLKELAHGFGAGKPVSQDIGLKIFKWNQELQKVAVSAIAAKVPGAASNGAFTHPAVAINLIHAALKDAELPLNERQVERIVEIGDRFIEDDARRNAGYNEETFALKKTIDECALKDRMFADIDELLTDEQRNVLHPESIRDRLGIDLYSSGTIWYVVTSPIDFKTSEDLPKELVKQYEQRVKLTEEELEILTRAAQDWAQTFDAAYLEASADPIAQTSRRDAGGGMTAGWQKIDQVRVAAKRQLALNQALMELIGGDEDKAKLIRADIRVHVPLKLP